MRGPIGLIKHQMLITIFLAIPSVSGLNNALPNRRPTVKRPQEPADLRKKVFVNPDAFLNLYREFRPTAFSELCELVFTNR